MFKYIISSGNSVVKSFLNNSEKISMEITTEMSPIYFNKIGDAMKVASEVNKLIGSTSYQVFPVEDTSADSSSFKKE